jgi:U6 snRNA phosphodiesterase
MESLLTSDLGAPLPLHVSLSRPIVFTADQKDSFVNSVHQNIARCGVRP